MPLLCEPWTQCGMQLLFCQLSWQYHYKPWGRKRLKAKILSSWEDLRQTSQRDDPRTEFYHTGNTSRERGKEDVSRGGNYSRIMVCLGNMRSWDTGLGLKFLSSWSCLYSLVLLQAPKVPGNPTFSPSVKLQWPAHSPGGIFPGNWAQPCQGKPPVPVSQAQPTRYSLSRFTRFTHESVHHFFCVYLKSTYLPAFTSPGINFWVC